MIEFFDISNNKIAKLIKELSDNAKVLAKKASDEEEKGRIALILLYYKVILQGCLKFGKDVNELVKCIKDSSIDEYDISMILDRFCDDDKQNAFLEEDNNVEVKPLNEKFEVL